MPDFFNTDPGERALPDLCCALGVRALENKKTVGDKNDREGNVVIGETP